MLSHLSAVIVLLAITVMPITVEARPDNVYGQWIVGEYKVVLSEDKVEENWDKLEVVKGNKVVFEKSEPDIELNPEYVVPSAHPTTKESIDTSSFHLGVPAFVVYVATGGSHCCFSAQLLMLGVEFVATDIVELGVELGPTFKRSRSAGSVVVNVADPSFQCFEGSCVRSPYPPVWLRLDPTKKRFMPYLELMKVPPASANRLKSLILEAQQEQKAARIERREGVPSAVSQPVFELVYTGNIMAAHQFLKRAWMGDGEERERYWSKVKSAIRENSPYWPAVAKFNHLD